MNAGQSSAPRLPSKPTDFASRCPSASSAANHIAFFGTQPRLTQVPPSSFGSNSVTFAPCLAARTAVATPPEPPPITSKSECFGIELPPWSAAPRHDYSRAPSMPWHPADQPKRLFASDTREQLVHFRTLRTIHLPFDGTRIAVDLFRPGRTCDDARHFGACEQPCEGEFQQAVAMVLAPRLELLDAVPVGFGLVAIAEVLPMREARIPRHILVALVLAGEQTAGEREVRHQRQAVRVQCRQ